MLRKLGGFGFLLLLLSLPLQAGHGHRSRHYQERSFAPGFVEIHVGTPYVEGVFVRGFRSYPRYYDNGYGYEYYPRENRRFRKLKYKRREYFRRHRHYHYDGYCPY